MMRVVGRSFSGSYFAAFLQWAKNGGNDAMNLEEEDIFFWLLHHQSKYIF